MTYSLLLYGYCFQNQWPLQMYVYKNKNIEQCLTLWFIQIVSDVFLSKVVVINWCLMWTSGTQIFRLITSINIWKFCQCYHWIIILCPEHARVCVCVCWYNRKKQSFILAVQLHGLVVNCTCSVIVQVRHRKVQTLEPDGINIHRCEGD